jgi:hypothetical protein
MAKGTDLATFFGHRRVGPISRRHLVGRRSGGHMLEAAARDTAPADLRNAINVIAGVDATLWGFLVSAGALLYAVANTRLARNLQRTGHFNRLLVDLFLDSAAFLAALIATMFCLFLPEVNSLKEPLLPIGVWVSVFLNVVAFLLLLPVGWKFWILLTNLEPDDQPTALE